MTVQDNPFALVRASDYTDQQINSLWVEWGAPVINAVIEPKSRRSKYILGGKGSGKTHLLRYHSYLVSRLRHPKDSGISILKQQKFLAIFLRATNVDATRFEDESLDSKRWQQLFGIYLELKLVEGVVDSLCDVKFSSPHETFNDIAFINAISGTINDQKLPTLKSIEEFRDWLIFERKKIDDAINNAAFTKELKIRIPFGIGALCIPISHAIAKWHGDLQDLPVIYLIDEIENFSLAQQQVVNSLIRYGEGLATFRVTGRLYAAKTFTTLADGEENREGAEFTTTHLDDLLRTYQKYPDFAERFIIKRLGAMGLVAPENGGVSSLFSPRRCFEEIRTDNFFDEPLRQLAPEGESNFVKTFQDIFRSSFLEHDTNRELIVENVSILLTEELPPLFQKLNILLFCKKRKRNISYVGLATQIRNDSLVFQQSKQQSRGYYATAYGHYAADLFAQLCRESKKAVGVPYAGFDTFVKMSSGNPRNLLIILGRVFEITAFKGIDFINGQSLSVTIQTDAALAAARFLYESDTNFGTSSELARDAVKRLAELLRTARFALNIPEVSPLAVSFSDSDLTDNAKRNLHNALNYSFLFEIYEGRPDRNSQRLNRKIQLNPLLSPRWGLPISRRGDLPLNSALLNSIFDPARGDEFNAALKVLDAKWNNPFKNTASSFQQTELF